MSVHTPLALLLAASLGGAACPAIDPRPKPPVDPKPEATCTETCAHWKSLGCEQAEPTPDGASCVEVCDNVMASEGMMYWDLDCRSQVTSCVAIDACED